MEIKKRKKKKKKTVPLFLLLVCFAIKSTILKRVRSLQTSAVHRAAVRKVGRARSETQCEFVPPDPLCCVFRAQRANSIRHQWLRNSGSSPPSRSLTPCAALSQCVMTSLLRFSQTVMQAAALLQDHTLILVLGLFLGFALCAGTVLSWTGTHCCSSCWGCDCCFCYSATCCLSLQHSERGKEIRT